MGLFITKALSVLLKINAFWVRYLINSVVLLKRLGASEKKVYLNMVMSPLP